MKKGIIYVRVSSEKQIKEWHWIDSQKIVCQKWADENNIKIVKIFEDSMSWSTENRPWFIEMIKFISKSWKNIDYVIVDDIDRIWRDVHLWLNFYKLCDSKWVHIQSLKQEIKNTPEQNLLTTITMATKQYERENNARRVKSRMEARLLAWYWPFYLPDWYSSDQNIKDKSKRIILNKNANLIKEWLIKFANGKIWNQNELLKFFISKWLRTRKWNIPPLSYMQRILSEKNLYFYAGYIIYPKWGINEPIKWHHPAIISLDIMNKILDRLNISKRIKNKCDDNIISQLWLRWIIKEPTTWRYYTGSPSKGKKWVRYYYYTLRITDPKTRKSKTINILNTKLHEELKEFLSKFCIKEEFVPLLKDLIDYALEHKKEESKILKKERTEQLNNINIKIEKLKDKLIKQDLSPELSEIYEEELVNLVKKKKTLEENKDLWIDNEISKISETTVKYFTNPNEIIDITNVSVKRDFINTLFEWELFYSKKWGIQTPSFPFIYQVFQELNFQNNHLVDFYDDIPNLSDEFKKHTHNLCNFILLSDDNYLNHLDEVYNKLIKIKF